MRRIQRYGTKWASSLPLSKPALPAFPSIPGGPRSPRNVFYAIGRNFLLYKKAVLVLLLFSFMLCGCSGKTGTEFQPNVSEEPLHESQQAPEETSPPETETAAPEQALAETVITEEDWENYFDGINGSAVIYTPSERSYQIYNQEMALSRRSPCSTFKIISSCLALEQKVMIPDRSVRTWSGEIFWNEDWNRDINFEDAFRTSCVWYYRELIDEIGKDAMQEALNKLQYGNCDISDWEGRLNTNNNNRALTGFWIESSLQISPKEQVEVLDRIFGEDSVCSQETQDSLKQVMLLSEQPDRDMLVYGKTGFGKTHGIAADAWFTGFADTADERKYFCVYLGKTDGKDVSSTKAKEIALEILSRLEWDE